MASEPDWCEVKTTSGPSPLPLDFMEGLSRHRQEQQRLIAAPRARSRIGHSLSHSAGHREVHPAQALRDYRRASGIDARLVVVGMVSNRFSIADPADPGMLDVVGFDTATPQLISDFARGSL